MTEKTTSSSGNDPVRFGGIKQTVATLILLALLTPLGGAFKLLLPLGVLVLGAYWYFRLAYHFGRTVGRVSVLVFVAFCATFGYLQYSAHEAIDQLEVRLEELSSATIQRKFLPLPWVYQLSVEHNVDDSHFSRIIDMPEMSNLTDVYLESDKLTDRSLETADKIEHLRYIFIDCKSITVAAIAEFERRHPDVTVIPYQR